MEDSLYDVLSYGVQYEPSRAVLLDALFAERDQDLLSKVACHLPTEVIDSLPKDFIGNSILDESNIEEENSSTNGFSINIFKNPERFVTRKFTSNKDLVVLNAKSTFRPQSNGKLSLVDSQEVFATNFSRITANQLRNISWNNLTVGGEAILACLDAFGPQDFNNAFNFYYNSTIDIYLVGLSTKESINKRIKSLIDEIRSANQSPLLCKRKKGYFGSGSNFKTVVRTAKSIIVLSEYPNKHINIILQSYKTKEEVLKEIDIDCLAVCFDGNDVFSSPRFIRALSTRHSVVKVPVHNTEVSSEKNGFYFKQLPDKIFKMTQLGFNIVIPDLTVDPFTVNDIIKPLVLQLEKDKENNVGLLRLLYLSEKNHTSSNIQVFLPYGDGWNILTMNQHLTKLFASYKQFSMARNIPYKPGFLHNENIDVLLNTNEFSENSETQRFDLHKWMKFTMDIEPVSREEILQEFETIEKLQENIKATYIDRVDFKKIEKITEEIDEYKRIRKFIDKVDKTNQGIIKAIEGISNDIERSFFSEAKNSEELESVYYYIRQLKESEVKDIQNTTRIISAKQKDLKMSLDMKEMEIRTLSNNLSEAMRSKIKLLEQLKKDEITLAKSIAKFDAFKSNAFGAKNNISPNEIKEFSVINMVEANRSKINNNTEATIKIEDSNTGHIGANSNNHNVNTSASTGGDRCYVCKRPYLRSHQNYPKMCNECGEFNYQKRTPKVNLNGKIALVTGARVKIGYYTALMLLRNGATVIATTRFTRDAALRFTQEPDYQIWKSRIFLYRIDFLDLSALSKFITFLQNKFTHLDILINNAAQTIRSHILPHELGSLNLCNENVKELLSTVEEESNSFQNTSTLNRMLSFLRADPEKSQASLMGPESGVNFLVDEHTDNNNNMSVEKTDNYDSTSFPIGQLDEDKQQIDKRPSTSWVQKTDEISELEAAEVHVINAIAPFLLVSKLKPLMVKSPSKSKYIINVSSPEGQFYKMKDATHPHTNMAKAALNMLTRTSADEYALNGIYMNAVDPGWVSLMQPYQISSQMSKPPLDNIDGAARIMDPIVDGVGNGKYYFGMFFKDYKPTKW